MTFKPVPFTEVASALIDVLSQEHTLVSFSGTDRESGRKLTYQEVAPGGTAPTIIPFAVYVGSQLVDRYQTLEAAVKAYNTTDPVRVDYTKENLAHGGL